MRHPYQCLAAASLGGQKSRQVLLAASGPELFVYDLSDATLLSSWPGEDSKDEDASNSSTEIITTSNEATHRARKRRKISTKTNGVNQRAKSGPITNLLVSNDSRYAIASTGEDKLVHVFEIEKDGHLQHLSQRRMTKRPCAIALTPKDDFVLVGDKFGDVYALPLHFQGSESALTKVCVEENGGKVARTPFKPSATNLTVHTERNLNALKNQMRQAQLQPAKTKDVMEFPHELLLGHVSMLTDIVCASKPSPKTESLNREYIITSDRDEHIRISRGASQAHIIENYCFGHEQFVSRLCLAGPDILVSGGGDNDLFVWDWSNGRLLGTLPIRSAVQRTWQAQTARIERGLDPKMGDDTAPSHESHEAAREPDEGPSGKGEPDEQTADARIAVTGIWVAPSSGAPSGGTPSITVYCSCEAVSAIFEFTFPATQGQHFTQESVGTKTYATPGNPLCMAVLHDMLVLSVDTAHETGSMVAREKRSVTEGARIPRLVSLQMESGSTFQPLNIGMDDGAELVDDAQFKKLKDLVYGVENLRKHGGEDAEQ